MKIAWVIDSASCIDKGFASLNDVHVIPLQVIFGDKCYDDQVDISEAQFYEWLEQGMMPTSSQPSLGSFIALYNRLQQQGYDMAISIHVSHAMSGTVDVARMAAKSVDFPVEVIDSGLVAKPMLFVLEEGLRLYEKRFKVEDIIAMMYTVRERIVGYFLINDLRYLHRGGRLKASSALIGSLLQIKPILHFENQYFDVVAKVRTARRAKEFLYHLLDEDASKNEIREINVVHANHLQEAEKWQTQLQNKFTNISIQLSTLGTVVGVHSGPKAIGLAWIK